MTSLTNVSKYRTCPVAKGYDTVTVTVLKPAPAMSTATRPPPKLQRHSTREQTYQLTIPVRLFSHALDHNLAIPAVCRAVRRDSRVKRVCVCATHPPTRSGTCMLQQIFMFIFISPHRDGRSRDFTHQRRLISSHSPRCRHNLLALCAHATCRPRGGWHGEAEAVVLVIRASLGSQQASIRGLGHTLHSTFQQSDDFF